MKAIARDLFETQQENLKKCWGEGYVENPFVQITDLEDQELAKLVIHKAYGFRTAANYIRNLYHCLGDLPLPKTVHTFV